MTTEDKRFYGNVMRLVMPMALQNLINVGVTSTDVIMLGRVGETALSGVSLANQVYFILSLIFFGLTSGACVLTAQYWGKQDTRTIEKVMGMSFRIAILSAAVFTALALCVPDLLMRIFTSDEAIIAEGVSYLRIVAFSYILAAFTNVYLNIIRSIERVVIATVVYATSLSVNIILNAVFIFGLLGAPALGAAGAAIGTLCARAVEVIIVVYYARKKNDVVRRCFYQIAAAEWFHSLCWKPAFGTAGYGLLGSYFSHSRDSPLKSALFLLLMGRYSGT